MSISLNLLTSAPTSPSNNPLPSPVSGPQPLPKSRRVGGPVPPSSIHPQRIELVCSYKPITKDPQNIPEDVSNPPPLISPLETILRAVLEKNPNYDFSRLDLIASRANLRKLFRLVSSSASRKKAPGELKFYVELIRSPVEIGRCAISDVAGTVLLSSGDLQEDDVAVTSDDAGEDHGVEFLEHHLEALNSDKSTECSENAKIVTYDFAGMRCMIKYPPTGKLPVTGSKQKDIQKQDGESEKCWRVRKRTKYRAINHVDEWRWKVHDGVSVDYKAHHNEDGSAVHDNVPGVIPSENADSSKDAEACMWQLEKLDQVVDLGSAMERIGMHSDVQYNNVAEIPQFKTPSFNGSQCNRQRGDSISSTSSAHSQASFRSMVSSRSSVSWGVGESSHQYHYHKKLQLLPTIAPTPPNEAESPIQYLGFDTPVSNIWYRANLASSFFDVDAVEPLDSHDDEQTHKDLGSEVVGKYRSTAQYRRVLQAWEKEHVENLKKLVDVLRKIRKAASKAGRCKVVIDSSGRIRAYRIKQSKEENEAEIGRVSILPSDLLAKWA
ncbi:hypothetical protein EV426DRAFT_719942 [Tirmania nivea]|nr:hypothetical protein EV426DRAFT_719942 [Tirmania nivea]